MQDRYDAGARRATLPADGITRGAGLISTRPLRAIVVKIAPAKKVADGPSRLQRSPAMTLARSNIRFEDKEHELFGKAGFEGTVAQVGTLEQTLGISDLHQFTPAA
jgi:hypothetical protein